MASCPAYLEPVRRRRPASKKKRCLLQAQELVEIFDGDGWAALGAAIMLSCRAGATGRGREEFDYAFLQSKLFLKICDALDLDDALWAEKLPKAPGGQ